MSSPTKKRPKSKHRNPPPSFPFLKEPSPGFFPSGAEILKLFAVVGIAVSVALVCNFVVTVLNRPPKPFCDTDDPISDFCDPCPNNGKCSKGSWECLHGFRKLGRLCVEDGEINQTAKKLSEWVEHHACEAYARFLCDGTGTVWFQEADISKKLDEYMLNETFASSNDIFMFTKQKAMNTVKSTLEMRTVSDGVTELKCPDWLVENYKSLTCIIRQWIYKHAFILVPVSALLIGCMRFFWRVRQSRYMATRAEQLYEQVCDILEENAMMVNSTCGEGVPWVIASQLRDHLLLPKERKNTMLWKKVEELVQEDSRADQYPKLVKGESKIVWEWQVEGSLSSKRRTKGAANKMISSERKYQITPPQQRKLQMGEVLNS
ncbi:man1-Src1p-carboxy-terminal domain protein [Tasmannia lanceolata]|uniref:man1-Src1p-carboxy-terminal domain protein n=1 Tax=Tasmannia lanceolata TaxID=3420 RepID=UPI0040636F17